MIIETVRQQLQGLFPASPEAAPITGGLDAQEGQKVEKGGKEAPRVDGIIERNYAERGYHLDVQVGPDQLLAAVGILV